MDIAKRLKELREKHNLTQEELAKELNVSRTTISNYENGSRSPDIEMINNNSLVIKMILCILTIN